MSSAELSMIVFQTTEGVLIDRGYLMKTHNEVAVIYRLVNAEANDRTASRAASETAVLPAVQYQIQTQR
jgi:hypothetical protein